MIDTDNNNSIELVTYKGISVYASDIEIITEDYINSLGNPDMIYKVGCFNGLLDSIYKRLLKNIIVNDTGITNNSYDFKVLDDIFINIYIPLCYRYDIAPSVLSFCNNICHISAANITDVKNGTYRSNGAKARQENTQIVKNWYSMCESGLVDKTVNCNSIGSIFLLKSAYSYQEKTTLEIENGSIQHETAEQIAAKHASAQLPEKPQLDD